ncbi:MAG: hypothetical protein ACRBK7_03620 [Acidimicrobiales bacterium]
MTAVLFADVAGVRPEINAAYQRVVNRWAQPGIVWSATQRLALWEVVRAARTAVELPPWQSPRTVPGLLDPDPALPDAAVDAAWRITNHPGTLTQDWYLQIIRGGLDPVGYVEVVGIVAMANSLEYFLAAIDGDAPGVPEPSATPPTGPLPSVTGSVSSHWVPTTDQDLPNVRKALSATPGELDMQAVLLDALYVPGGALAVELDEKIWSLERTQVELVASRVSTLNECFY